MAMTADGKIATANRTLSSFGSKRDLEHLYELRATADAVMNGARTVEKNNVTMGNGSARFRDLRRRNGLADHPLRVIVSGSGSIDPGAAIFERGSAPIILITTQRAAKAQLHRLLHLAYEALVCGEGEIDFGVALEHLRARWKVKRLLCEGGGELNSALFRAGLVDELHLTLCPAIVGGRSAPTIADGAAGLRLADAARLQLVSAESRGNELFAVWRKV